MGIHEHLRRDGMKVRLVVEKPQGNDANSYKQLSVELLKIFSEDELYLMDHYLGKVSVQKIPQARQLGELKALWNKENITLMMVFMDEKVDAHDRGATYEQSGVVRDVIQNHILQMFALATMDVTVNDARKAKVAVLQKTAVKQSLLAQYQGYTAHEGVSNTSTVPTFALIRVEV